MSHRIPEPYRESPKNKPWATKWELGYFLKIILENFISLQNKLYLVIH